MLDMVLRLRTACAGARTHTEREEQSQVSDNDTPRSRHGLKGPRFPERPRPLRRLLSAHPSALPRLRRAGCAPLPSPRGRSSPPPADAFLQCPLERPRGCRVSNPRADPRPRRGLLSRGRSLWSPASIINGPARASATRGRGDGTELEPRDNSIPRGRRETLAREAPALPQCARPSLPPAPQLPHPRLPRRGRLLLRPHRAMPSHRSSAAVSRAATAAAAARAAESR